MPMVFSSVACRPAPTSRTTASRGCVSVGAAAVPAARAPALKPARMPLHMGSCARAGARRSTVTVAAVSTGTMTITEKFAQLQADKQCVPPHPFVLAATHACGGGRTATRMRSGVVERAGAQYPRTVRHASGALGSLHGSPASSFGRQVVRRARYWRRCCISLCIERMILPTTFTHRHAGCQPQLRTSSPRCGAQYTASQPWGDVPNAYVWTGRCAANPAPPTRGCTHPYLLGPRDHQPRGARRSVARVVMRTPCPVERSVLGGGFTVPTPLAIPSREDGGLAEAVRVGGAHEYPGGATHSTSNPTLPPPFQMGALGAAGYGARTLSWVCRKAWPCSGAMTSPSAAARLLYSLTQ